MGRLIVLILCVLGIVFIVRILMGSRMKKNRSQNANSSDQARTIDTMVKCVVCDMHVPQLHAKKQNGKYYCSQEHQLVDNS